MASIRRRNGKYQVQIRVGSYSRSQSFHRFNDAKSWARKEEELAEQRRYLGSKYEPCNLAEILVRYKRDITAYKRSCATERIVLKALLKEDWVKAPLPQLNAAAIAEYLSQYSDEQLKGFLANVKGIYHELIFTHAENYD